MVMSNNPEPKDPYARWLKSPDVRKTFLNTIPNDKFNSIFDEHSEALSIFLKKNKTKEFCPQLLVAVATDDGKLRLILIPPLPFDENRTLTMFRIGCQLGANKAGIVAAWLQSEAWALDVRKSPVPIGNYKSISNHPERVETIIMSGMTIDGRVNTRTWKIDRDQDSNIVLGEKIIEIRAGDNGSVESEAKLLESLFRGFLGTVDAIHGKL